MKKYTHLTSLNGIDPIPLTLGKKVETEKQAKPVFHNGQKLKEGFFLNEGMLGYVPPKIHPKKDFLFIIDELSYFKQTSDIDVDKQAGSIKNHDSSIPSSGDFLTVDDFFNKVTSIDFTTFNSLLSDEFLKNVMKDDRYLSVSPHINDLFIRRFEGFDGYLKLIDRNDVKLTYSELCHLHYGEYDACLEHINRLLQSTNVDDKVCGLMTCIITNYFHDLHFRLYCPRIIKSLSDKEINKLISLEKFKYLKPSQQKPYFIQLHEVTIGKCLDQLNVTNSSINTGLTNFVEPSISPSLKENPQKTISFDSLLLCKDIQLCSGQEGTFTDKVITPKLLSSRKVADADLPKCIIPRHENWYVNNKI